MSRPDDGNGENGADESRDAAPDPAAEQVDAAAEWRDKYLRLLADNDNFRKRVERDREQTRLYACEGLMRDLLPVLDGLQLAIDAPGDAGAIRDGVQLALQEALRIMADKGLAPIDALGEMFDPRFHEAVGALPATEGQAQGTIVAELRRGYRLHERVLRPSRVHIAMQPQQPGKPDKD
jgi:molecular chaperone GrpE